MTQKGSGASRRSTSQQEEFKVVIVGDRGCGKTSLFTVYTTGVFPEWYPEVQHFCYGRPIILVGCKADLREDKLQMKRLWASGQNAVTFIQGEEARRKIGAVLYLECSAKYKENVDDLFRQATKQALMATREPEEASQQGSLCALL
uniref:Ras homolog family member F, filopodia associated n=1 Tax=Lates calcarifer TaxID=8187 RepID=A0A4W6FS60_LATCA